jgi:arylamine N-acetyltransferase
MAPPLLSLFCNHHKIPLAQPKRELLAQVLKSFSAIPYENLSKIIRANEELSSHLFQTPEEVLIGHFTTGSGGTCFPLTETLTHLIQEIGFEAAPILADRRYGADTHCAVLALIDGVQHLIDPGYLIFSPVAIPHQGAVTVNTPFSTVRLTRIPAPSDYIELATVEDDGRTRYRLTYKTTPVDEADFKAAWRRSFEWEMMTYPVISSISGESQIYIQKSSLTVRSKEGSTRINLTQDALIQEVSTRLSIDPVVVRRALGYLSK